MYLYYSCSYNNHSHSSSSSSLSLVSVPGFGGGGIMADMRSMTFGGLSLVASLMPDIPFRRRANLLCKSAMRSPPGAAFGVAR